jgi:hypothetical protein
MKRKPKKPNKTYRVHKIWSLFLWNKCFLCEEEFRREWGWRYDYPVSGRASKPYYVCWGCCPTIEEVAQAVVDRRVELMASACKSIDIKLSKK